MKINKIEMKKLIIALLMVLPLGAFAENTKIGYVNKQEIMGAMPEYNDAMKVLEDMNLKYITEGKKLEEEFQRKYQEYASQAETLDAAIRQYKENELARLQQSIQEFTKSADETLKKTHDEFKVLQDRWKSIGDVPRGEINNLWQNYHFLVEKFFNKVKINRELRMLDLKRNLEKDFDSWIAVFSEKEAFPNGIITVRNVRKGFGNIAGVEIPIFEGADFSRGDYDLYETPLWIDIAANHMERAMILDLEAEVLEEQVRLLGAELRATSQRVNLFEKVKIPETEENIKKISVYLADQQVSAVVRSKISKRKIAARDSASLEEEEVYAL